jgi:hypothetical protein
VFYVASIILLQKVNQSLPELVLPMLLIGGVVALLLTLAIVAVVYSRYRLSDPGAALALPEGSVRAVIALSLILIFAILALFLYSTLRSGTVHTSVGLTQEEIDALPAEVKAQVVEIKPHAAAPATPSPEATVEPGTTPSPGTTPGPATTPSPNGQTFDVVISAPPSEASQDFATQVLTTVSTLVVALSAFYFGAKTATSPGAEIPSLRIVKPTSPYTPAGEDEIDIQLEVRPAGSRVSADVVAGRGDLSRPDGDDYTKWNFAIPSPVERTVILFYLSEHPAALQRLVIEPPNGDGRETSEAPKPPVQEAPKPLGEESAPVDMEEADTEGTDTKLVDEDRSQDTLAGDVPAREVPVKDVPAGDL